MVELAPALLGSLKTFKDNQARNNRGEHEPPIGGKEMADADQHLRQKWEGNVHAFKNGHELGQHIGHEKKHDPDADDGDKSRINQRRSEFGLDLGETLE